MKKHRDTARSMAATKWASAYSPPREEGRLRHQENFGAAHLSAADGVVAHKSHPGVSDHPVRSNNEASRHFLNVASPPLLTRRGLLSPKNLLEKKPYSKIALKVKPRHCFELTRLRPPSMERRKLLANKISLNL